ncbi:MAG TPA: EAL domain-containing protein [Thermoleophilaceae bacterium]|nr:EAL domain-containing protein [Thermoleophilaceae bacterium]
MLIVRVGLALAALAVGMTVAGVLAARQEAGRRVDERAATAKAVFDQSLRVRLSHAHSASARGRAPSKAAMDAARVTGTEAAVGDAAAPVGTRAYSYPITGGGRLTLAVSTTPISSATRMALLIGLGIGGGALLLLVPLLAAGVERRLPVQDRRRVSEAPASDPLTGATSIQQFHESLGIEFKRAQREGSALSLAVIEIKGFGALDDGGEVLQRLAGELRSIMRATDLLARLGEDEFALILPGTDAELAASIGERARQAVSDASTEERRLSCSVGAACYPDDARDGSTLLQLASGALRWAQSSGDSEVRRYDPKNVTPPSDEAERAEIESLLARETPLIPFFQPLVSLSTGRVVGYEALSRFPEPPGRGPDAWFAQAARVGLAAPLEAVALREALAKPDRPAGTFLSLNVSPTTLGSPEVQAVLPEDMTGLVVEITEHELATDLDALGEQLAALRTRGARIAVDDAGVGYSGLQQVMRIKPDVIKLDRSLVMNLHEDAAKEALCDSFVRFARRTGASVCAEGIETMEELKLLADLDVTYGQGYVLARPGADWGSVPSSVSDLLLRSSLRSQGDLSRKDHLPESGDQRLEYVTAHLSKIGAVEDLEEVFGLIAAELGANAVCLSRWIRDHNAVETVLDTAGDAAGTRFNLHNYPSTAHVLNTGEAVQVLTSDPGADLGEVSLLSRLGYHSLLMVPVVCRDERLGLLEAYGAKERPWTRSEINRARIISYQLGAVLDGLERVSAAA